jgi:hypothetical protein
MTIRRHVTRNINSGLTSVKFHVVTHSTMKAGIDGNDVLRRPLLDASYRALEEE